MAYIGRNLTFCWCFLVSMVLFMLVFGSLLLSFEDILRTGKAGFLAILSLLMKQLGQRVLQRLVVELTIAEHVDGRIDGLAHRVLVGYALACYVISCTVIW